ncbi:MULTISPECIES: Cys-tRNA(Pro) deacylase [Brevibacterium]|jgi:Cys-tRNA(Pro)/Cys-tRNA(Cys) deacylase|uniref:Cys-tRNA(Pro) deacylase n=1 Tax=Brevibacterium TaxID=1696 RepID=UPI0025C15B6B|nr:Cys-tRNA(Pro) deacylase [Brevibacterium sp.]
MSRQTKVAAATPAIRVLSLAGVEFSVHEFDHDPAARRYGSEACEKLGVEPSRVLKTLHILVDSTPVNALVPVSGQLDLKALASAAGGKKAVLAGIAEAERRTGYVTGGISPMGQRASLPLFIDESAVAHSTVLVSAGRRGLELELRPTDLVMITNATVARIANLD